MRRYKWCTFYTLWLTYTLHTKVQYRYISHICTFIYIAMKLTSGLIRRLGQTWTQIWRELDLTWKVLSRFCLNMLNSGKETNKTFGIFWHLRSKILLMLESESSVLVKSVMVLHIFGDIREYVLWSPLQKTQLWLFLSSWWRIFINIWFWYFKSWWEIMSKFLFLWHPYALILLFF